jgi:hypothetical protein
MRLETLLPPGQVDPGLRAPEIPFEIDTVGDNARLLEEIGYDSLVCEETNGANRRSGHAGDAPGALAPNSRYRASPGVPAGTA